MDSFAPLYLVGDRMLSHHYQIEGGIGEGGPDTAPSCPRCASPNTKFCYYNNYSLSQPRFLCKSCRRYWTKGGSLRNVPIGGGCRKSRRTKAAARKALRADNSPAPIGDNGLSSDPASGNEIDMATVFAKFLNQRTEYKEKKKFDDLAQIQENLMENEEDTLVIPDPVVGQGDLLWSDSTSPDLPEFMWQLESPFPSDEYWKVSIGDNWSSGFDFPGFDVLSNAK